MPCQPPLANQKPTNTHLADPRYLSEQFHPGHWLDRRQKDVASLTAISGCYKRNNPVSGGWHSSDIHYFDMCLANRPASSIGRFGDNPGNMKPLGEIFFVPAGQRYFVESGTGLQRNLFVFLDAKAHFEDERLLEEDQAPVSMLNDCIDLHSDAIKVLLKRISHELYEPGFASELLLEGLGTTLLAETIRLFQQKKERHISRGGLSSRCIRMIEARIREGENLPSLLELSELCQLSRRHLMRAFKEQTGQTVGAYIQKITMDKAKHLLVHTDKPVSLIASASGFSSPAAFSTAFRRATGESPSSYRSSRRVLQVCLERQRT